MFGPSWRLFVIQLDQSFQETYGIYCNQNYNKYITVEDTYLFKLLIIGGHWWIEILVGAWFTGAQFIFIKVC